MPGDRWLFENEGRTANQRYRRREKRIEKSREGPNALRGSCNHIPSEAAARSGETDRGPGGLIHAGADGGPNGVFITMIDAGESSRLPGGSSNIEAAGEEPA